MKLCECRCGRALTARQIAKGRRFASRRCAKVVTAPTVVRRSVAVTPHWKKG